MSQFLHMGKKSFNGYERNCLFRNRGADGFVNVGAVSGADRIEDARGLGVGDIDNDGDLDLVVQNYRQSAKVLINYGAEGHWLQVRLHGGEGNRSAIGARLTIRYGEQTQTQTISCGEAYLSCSSRLAHFGLGAATSVDELRVRWPSGRERVLRNLRADQRVRIVEGSDGYDALFVKRAPEASEAQPASAPLELNTEDDSLPPSPPVSTESPFTR